MGFLRRSLVGSDLNMRASWAGFRQETRRLSREPIWLDVLVLVQQLIRFLQIVFPWKSAFATMRTLYSASSFAA
jgi:hypothetical protein